jgi:Glycosyl transferase family 2
MGAFKIAVAPSMSDVERGTTDPVLPKVSVCVVTYNHVGYIADCVLSALHQQGPFEVHVLVGDDGSTDGTREVLRALTSAWPSRLTVYEHERNLGPSENIRFVMSRADGEFVAHLDGDDFWLPGKLRAQLRFLQDHPQVTAVYSNALAVRSDMTPVGFFNGPVPETFDAEFLLERGNFLSHSSLCYRSSARPVLVSDPAPLLDFRMHLWLSTLGRLGYLNSVLVGYRSGVHASLTTGFSAAVLALCWQTLSEFGQRPELRRAVRRGAATLVIDQLARSVVRLDAPGVVAALAGARRLPPLTRRGLPMRIVLSLGSRVMRWIGRAWRRPSEPRILFRR